MAVGLLQLREAANDGLAGDDALAKDHFDALWVDVVSGLCDHEDVSTLSLKQFYAKFARQGGYLFPQNCPRPGWQCLWHGRDRRSKRLRQKYFANVLEVKKNMPQTQAAGQD